MTRRTKDIALAQAGPALRDYEEWVLTFWGERRRANGAFPFYGPGVGKVSRPMATVAGGAAFLAGWEPRR